MVPSFETEVSVLDRFLSVRYPNLFSGFFWSGISTVSAKAPFIAATRPDKIRTANLIHGGCMAARSNAHVFEQ